MTDPVGVGGFRQCVAVRWQINYIAPNPLLSWHQDIADLDNVIAIAAGTYHNLALKSDGTVAAWGGTNYGQLDVPVGLSGVVAISAGIRFSLALKSDGKAWGLNDYDQLNFPPCLSHTSEDT